MKHLIVVLLLITLLLSACGQSTAPDHTEAPSTSFDETAAPSTVPVTTPSTEKPVETEVAAPSSKVTYSMGEIYHNDLGASWIRGLVQICNDGNVPLVMKPSALTFTDPNGNIVCTMENVSFYPQTILPGEFGYYYEETPLDSAYEGELSVECTSNSVPTSNDIIRYDVAHTGIFDAPYGGLQLVGQITNQSEQTGKMICLCAILFDSEGLPIGILQQIMTDPLEAEQSIPFVLESFMLPEGITAEQVANYQVYAYPLTLAD